MHAITRHERTSLCTQYNIIIVELNQR